MRKLMIMAAMLAMLALVAAPALAQSFDFENDNDRDNRGFFFDNNDNFGGGEGVSLDLDQEADDTGDVDLNTEVLQSGNSSNQCVAPLQFGNTGNFQNQQGFLQYGSSADDVELEGGEFVFAPEQAVVCGQSVEQAAAASSR